MYCSNCGTYNPDEAKFCSECGLVLKKEEQRSNNDYLLDKEFNGYNWGGERSVPAVETGAGADEVITGSYTPADRGYTAPAKVYKMGWHKFLIYFSLWVGALANLASGIQAITGAQYDGAANRVYLMYDGLQFADIAYGILLVGLAVLAIVTRYQLARFKRTGPKLLTVLYAGLVIVQVLYILAAGLITGMNFFETSLISNIAASIAVIFINLKYYSNRASLFVN